jgi:hypothetical protein
MMVAFLKTGGKIMQIMMKQRLMKENLWLIGVTMADLISTIILIGMGLCREMNPIMNYFLQIGWTPFIAFKLATIVLAVSVTEWYRKHDEIFIRRWLRIGVVSYVGVWSIWFTAANLR